MERWQGKVAVVTGTSSGIGEVLVPYLLKHGIIVVGLARREDRLIENKNKLPKEHQDNYYPKKCDVSKDNEVIEVFDWIEKNLGGVDILVNNAGVFKRGIYLTTPETSDPLKETLDVNVMGVVYCTREAFKSMKNRNVAGHVILINSVTGYKIVNIPGFPQRLNIYAASKFAITAMTEVYRQEFQDQNTKVKITSLSPGVVDTEMLPDEFREHKIPTLTSEEVCDAILYVLGTPPHVQIHELTIKHIGEMF